MSRRLTVFLFLALLTIAAWSRTGKVLQARQALNVGLVRFEGIPLDNAVRLEWDTETELGTAGYKIKRGQNSALVYLPAPSGNSDLFIGSEGGPNLGFDYSYTDDTAVNGERYTYQLIEIEVDGSEIPLADTTVAAGLVPTKTPIVVFAGGNGGGNSTATATATQSTTPQATQMANPTATPLRTVVPTLVLPATATLAPSYPGDEPAPLANSTVAILAQSTTSPNQSDIEDESSQTEGIDVDVVLAQEEQVAEEPSISPNVNAVAFDDIRGIFLNTSYTVIGSSFSVTTSSYTIKERATGPLVIGQRQYPDNSLVSEPETQDAETDAAGDSLLGKIYLWVAFFAAFVIFVAAVIGAILLYTRQRIKE